LAFSQDEGLVTFSRLPWLTWDLSLEQGSLDPTEGADALEEHFGWRGFQGLGVGRRGWRLKAEDVAFDNALVGTGRGITRPGHTIGRSAQCQRSHRAHQLSVAVLHIYLITL